MFSRALSLASASPSVSSHQAPPPVQLLFPHDLHSPAMALPALSASCQL